MTFSKSEQYAESLFKKHMMGPNCMKMLEELTAWINISRGMRFLDLGCGMGLTSIFLAKEFEVQVFATDLWVSASENYKTFLTLNLDQYIIPIHADALEMPYAEEYFDGVISMDSYHYFGLDPLFMSKNLAPLVKKGGLIAIAIPGLKEEFDGSIPDEMLISWTPEDIKTMHSCRWWREIFNQSPEIEIKYIYEMSCFDECWSDWLACDNEHAIQDRQSMEAGAGKYMNLIGAILSKK